MKNLSRTFSISAVLIIVFAGLWWRYWPSGDSLSAPPITHLHGPHGTDEHDENAPLPHGVHGGVLVDDIDIAIELVLVKQADEKWIYAYPYAANRKPLSNDGITMTMTFTNDDLKEVVRFDAFENNNLRGQLPEDRLLGWQLNLLLEHEKHAHQWRLKNAINQP